MPACAPPHPVRLATRGGAVALAFALIIAPAGSQAAEPAATPAPSAPPAPTESKPTAPTASCEQAGSDQSVVQGRLGLLEGLGPAAFIVTVPAGLCLTGKEPPDNVSQALTVQLFSTTAEGFQDLYKMVGERVYVRGKLSGLRSYQQKAPVLMEVIEIATR
jgi:hypothetical protein